jgi:hypothetical protein
MNGEGIPCICEDINCNLPATVRPAPNPGEVPRAIPPFSPDAA